MIVQKVNYPKRYSKLDIVSIPLRRGKKLSDSVYDTNAFIC